MTDADSTRRCEAAAGTRGPAPPASRVESTSVSSVPRWWRFLHACERLNSTLMRPNRLSEAYCTEIETGPKVPTAY